MSSQLLWEHIQQRVHTAVRECKYTTDMIGIVQVFLCFAVFGFIQRLDEKHNMIGSPAYEEGCNNTQHHHYSPVPFSVWSLQNCLEDGRIAENNDGEWKEEEQGHLEIISQLDIRATRDVFTRVKIIPEHYHLYFDGITHGCSNADDPGGCTGNHCTPLPPYTVARPLVQHHCYETIDSHCSQYKDAAV